MFPITAGLGALSYLTSLLQSSTAATSSSQSGDPLSQLTQGLDSDGDGDQSPTAAASVGSGGTTQPFDPGTLASLISAQGQASGSSNGQDLSSLLNAADASGAKTQTVTNADGSTTTTITYPDGSNVSTTTPASMSTSGNDASGSSGSGTSSQSNLLEQLVQMQSQFLSQSASTLSTVA
jgi:hypothetical protein